MTAATRIDVAATGPTAAGPEETAGRSSWQHVASLDGLRAIAVIAVLLFHAGHLEGGFLGVDLFFALSGFLITSLLVRDARSSGIRLAAFYGRRFRRLLPAVYALIVAATVWTWASGSPALVDSVRSDGVWAVAYVANWHLIADSSSYWSSFAEPSMFDHLWSLAIEEQFYLLWPLVLLGVWTWARRPDRALLVVCITGVAASLVAMVVLHDGGDPTRVYMGTDTRAASLLVGATAATWPCRRLAAAIVARLGRGTTALLAAVGATVLWSWVATDGASSAILYRGGLLLHSTACALVVALVVAAQATAGARVLRWRPLVWIGTLSYGLYLWHWPVYMLVSSERTNLDGVALTVARITVSTACALVSYHAIENPIRYRAAWVRGRRGLLALTAAVVGTTVVLTRMPVPATQIAAFDPATIETTPVPLTTEPTTSLTTERTRPPTAGSAGVARIAPAPPSSSTSTTTAPPMPIRQALWAGDSIAFDLAPAVHAALTAAGVAVDPSTAYVGYRIGSPDEDSPLVGAVRQQVVALGADLVILQLSVWDASLEAAAQAAALTYFRDVVVGHGARLLLVSAPVVGEDQINSGLLTLTAAARQLSAADPQQVLFLDASTVWGAEMARDLDADGTPERKRDSVHICPSGAARFAAWLAGELSTRFAAVVPAPPTTWATGPWVTDDRYDDPPGACDRMG